MCDAPLASDLVRNARHPSQALSTMKREQGLHPLYTDLRHAPANLSIFRLDLSSFWLEFKN